MSRPRMTTELAELRGWSRESNIDITGTVYNDPDSFWEDGDFGVFTIDHILDTGAFYILISAGKTIFKLEYDQERPTSRGIK